MGNRIERSVLLGINDTGGSSNRECCDESNVVGEKTQQDAHPAERLCDPPMSAHDAAAIPRIRNVHVVPSELREMGTEKRRLPVRWVERAASQTCPEG